MSVGAPGSYRFMSWRPRYTPELVASLLPTVWGRGLQSDVESRVIERCIRGAGKCAHSCDEDQWDEGCIVDGDHKVCAHRHLGHDQCGKCMCVDPSSRRSNDNRESDLASMLMDVANAWEYAPLTHKVRLALYLRHATDDSEEEIAAFEGVTQPAISLRLKAGHGLLADYLNGALDE